MRAQLRRFMIWPVRNVPKRSVEFAEIPTGQQGQVYVIRGNNGTGKSALLSGLDYCLGSEISQLPVDPIFQSVAWYGVHLVRGAEHLVILRKAPDWNGKASEDFIVSDDPEVGPFTGTIRNRAGAISAMDSWSLSADGDEEAEDDEGQGVDDDSAEIEEEEEFPILHDVSPFLLAPSDYLTQQVGMMRSPIASFDRGKKILPLCIQSATAEGIALERRYKKARAATRKAGREVESRAESLSPIERHLALQYESASSFGLVTGSAASTGEKLAELAELAERLGGGADFDGWTEILATMRQLETEQRRLGRERNVLLERLAGLERANVAADDLLGQLNGARIRARPLHWLVEHVRADGPCALCGADSEEAHVTLAEVQAEVAVLEREMVAVARTRDDALWSETATVRAELQRVDEEYRAVSRRRLEFRTGGRENGRPTSIADMHRLMGGLAPLLATKEPLLALEALREKLGVLAAILEELEGQRAALDPDAAVPELEADFKEHMKYYADLMHLYFRDAPMRFVLKSLNFTLNLGNGPAPQWRKVEHIGAAMNWMGYKVAAHLAMQELFAKYEDSPAPAFVVFDQPSQVDSGGTAAQTLTDKVFDAMVHTAEVIRVQVIVLEGLAEHRFLSSPRIRVIETWESTDNGLIPRAWYS